MSDSGAIGDAGGAPLSVGVVRDLLAAISSLRVLVVGDICLDRWCMYDPSLAEASRETGIPRVAVMSYEATPGAGGTVANNLVAMGVKEVGVLGVQGDDGAGFELRRALASLRIESGYMVMDPRAQTFTYTKYLNLTTGNEDLPRTDFINAKPWSAGVEARVIAQLRRAAAEADAILVSDQAETHEGGVVTAGVREALSAIARTGAHRTVWVDSRMRAEHFRDVIVKTNEQESWMACDRLGIARDPSLLLRHTKAAMFIVTHGGDGVDVFRSEGAQFVSTDRVEEPVDICGAGDSFSAGAAMALAATGDPVLAARFGNLVASITIMKKGTGTASPDEILHAAECVKR
ncbi:MAG: PfkB family carbohydrate kinase [Bryobacterales bacterium]|nr:PfkB family carbohydrate kinase [Bryobacterales bacterium]